MMMFHAKGQWLRCDLLLVMVMVTVMVMVLVLVLVVLVVVVVLATPTVEIRKAGGEKAPSIGPLVLHQSHDRLGFWAGMLAHGVHQIVDIRRRHVEHLHKLTAGS
jgi:hypothetical protein